MSPAARINSFFGVAIAFIAVQLLADLITSNFATYFFSPQGILLLISYVLATVSAFFYRSTAIKITSKLEVQNLKKQKITLAVVIAADFLALSLQYLYQFHTNTTDFFRALVVVSTLTIIIDTYVDLGKNWKATEVIKLEAPSAAED